MSTAITIQGNLSQDVELRFTNNGKAIAKFTVVTSRRKKQDSGEWTDEGVTFWNCTAWDALAENVAESLLKGDGVIVMGTAENRSWEKDGIKHNRIEITAQKVAVELSRWVVKPARDMKSKERSKGGPDDDMWTTNPRQAADDVPF